MPLPSEKYHDIFVSSGLLTEEDYRRVTEEAKESGRPIEAAVVGLGLYSDDQIGRLMADAYGVKFVNLLQTGMDQKAVLTLPDLFLKKHHLVPFAWDGDRLRLAMTDPSDLEVVGFIEKKTGLPVTIEYTTPGILEEGMRSYTKDIVGQITTLAERFEAVRGKAKDGRSEAGVESLVITVADLILQYGYANNASDVHIEPEEKTCLIRYRVDGILHDVLKLSKALHEMIVSRIKIMSGLRTDEHFAAQDGKLRMRAGKKQVDVRVSVMPVVGGEKVVMRILSEKGRAFTLETLGFSEQDLAKVRAAAEKPYGMILATGPTGSGKTTTLYAILKILNTREVNIQTIEDPVEYDIEGVNQIQVNPHTNLSFAAGLRSIVRQDPVIMVGEIRDAKTAGIAVNSAMTGHLVLSTLHTNDAATAIPRLLDLEVEPFLVALP
jgi:type II secretory ATPase GspE/PulE/Tfp pilus assembly ATPase PilB-like protein